MDPNPSPDATSSPQIRRVFLYWGFLFLGVVAMVLGLFALQRQQAEQLRLLDLARQAREAEAARQVQRATQGHPQQGIAQQANGVK